MWNHSLHFNYLVPSVTEYYLFFPFSATFQLVLLRKVPYPITFWLLNLYYPCFLAVIGAVFVRKNLLHVPV